MSDFYSATPDSARYRLMSQGGKVEMPYHLRWLAPKVCRNDLAWIIVSHVSVAATAILAAIYADARPAIFLTLGLAGITIFNIKHPILVDAPAIALALGAAICVQHGQPLPAVFLALAAGATKETSPIFAALWGWSPLPLLGLAAPLLRWALVRPGLDTVQDDATEARKNLRAILVKQRITFSDPSYYLIPWGMCLLGLAHGSPQLWLTLAVAYAQCAIATDTVRLYQWSFPVLVAATCHVVPAIWWIPMCAIHVANPFRSTGV